MSRQTKSLAQWCAENGRDDILREVAPIEEKELPYSTSPDCIEYNSPLRIVWLCNEGHKWKCPVVGRLLFNLKCPICFPDGDVLPIGTSYGCITIISEPIEKNEKFFRIERTERYYKCRCKCGRIHELDEFHFLEKKHRYCTDDISRKRIEDLRIVWEFERSCHPFADGGIDDQHPDKQDETTDTFSFEEQIKKKFCGLAVKAWKAKQQTYKENGRRSYAENYKINFTGKFFESLEIQECVEDNYEELEGHSDLRMKDAYWYKVYKRYRCRCYLCGKEHIVKCSQFHIDPPTEYGPTAYHGYWSGVQCDCHKISSFQWIVNKLLFENNISYRVEYSFPDLLGTFHSNNLKFDFAVFNPDGTLKCVIECQGEQHYMPVDEFGGATQHHLQKQNDSLKRKYTQEHGIKMIEISYKDKKYEKVKAILEKHGII